MNFYNRKLIFFLNIILISCQKIARNECEKLNNIVDKITIQKTLPRGTNRYPRHIVGGTKSAPEEFPFMAALGYEDNGDIQWECGGALISEKFVLTAAHCAYHRELGAVKIVRLGTIDLRLTLGQKPAQDIQVKKVKTHPEYLPPSLYNDIALIELKSNVNFSSNTLPACLNTETGLHNIPVTAMGWGRLDFSGDQSNELMKVVLSLFPSNECKKAYDSEPSERLRNSINSEIQMCAGTKGKTQRDTCQGDSGGPLHMASGSKHIIVGITSFGKACGIANAPGVYTRVSAYVPWLERNVWGNY